MGERIRKLCIIILPVLIILGCGGCGKTELKLKDYKIYRVEGSDSVEMTQFFMELATQETGVRLKNTAEEQGSWISLISAEGSANEYGYTVEQMEPKAFTIIRNGTHLFVLARTDEGMKRGCRFLLRDLIDEKGNLLLADGDVYADTAMNLKEAIYIGNVPITEYTILYEDKRVISICEELQDYIYQTDGELLAVEAEKNRKGLGILLTVNSEMADAGGRITIDSGEIVIEGSDAGALRQEVYRFINTYMGWMNAGQTDAHISSTSRSIHIPADVKAVEAPWMEEREAIVTLWNVNYTRGVHLNEAVSLKNNLLDYTEEQLYEYVKTLKYCGFTGVQVTDMCSAWAGTDSYAATHEKIRTMADAAHSLGMKFTLWVWGANFDGFSWVDDTVTYAVGESGYAYDNPLTVAVFEKYYSRYAELADCCDRVIAHFYDPGMLYQSQDVAYFSKMLRDKFLAVNPNIDFGVSCWVDAFDKGTFVNALGSDITLYEGIFHDNEQEQEGFRSSVAALGTRLGTWAWNTCEMEIDQLAQMNFNLDVIRETYQVAKKYDEIKKPAYWSEMDSYHILNAFSLYCAGQLLINPDRSSEELYEELSYAVVGEEYAEAFTEILRIIQDARSGSTWDEYWWGSENYIVKSKAYPAESILKRCDIYIPVLQEMIDKDIESNTFPFPISLNEVLRMVLPHLEQIREYASFRIGIEELERNWRQGMSMEQITLSLQEIAKPISSYNSVVGLWGQIEARAQREIVLDFCHRTGVDIPIYPEWDRLRKQYIYAQVVTDQKGREEPLKVYAPYYQYGLAYGEETERLVQELVAEGLFIQDSDGGIYLTDWKNYKYHFD